MCVGVEEQRRLTGTDSSFVCAWGDGMYRASFSAASRGNVWHLDSGNSEHDQSIVFASLRVSSVTVGGMCSILPWMNSVPNLEECARGVKTVERATQRAKALQAQGTRCARRAPLARTRAKSKTAARHVNSHTHKCKTGHSSSTGTNCCMPPLKRRSVEKFCLTLCRPVLSMRSQRIRCGGAGSQL